MQNRVQNKWNRLRVIIQKSLDNTSTPEEIDFLRGCLLADPEARRYYIDYMTVYSSLFLISGELSSETNDLNVRAMDKALLDLSAYEKTAPVVDVPKEKPAREVIQNLAYTRPSRRINKFSLFSAIFSAAALLLLVVLVRFVPYSGGRPVATLADSLHARWSGDNNVLQKGVRLTDHQPMLLLEGVAELLFDNNAAVVVEGPAAFKILAEDRIALDYGKIYATVPQEAIGFCISTKAGKIIDLGTEFGIQADAGGDMELHVLRGRTMLIAGENAEKISTEVGAGYAKKISVAAQKVSDIPCQKELFVRMIDSKAKLVWKGQNQLSLADIAGSGNGLGAGRLYSGINPVTGRTTSLHFDNRKTTNEYRPVVSNPFIDGVFIPNGRTEQIVSSGDHVFQECPITTGELWTDIVSMPISSGKEWKPEGIASSRGQLVEGANLDRTEEGLLMHANLGITFDLRAIRSMLPDAKITRFRSQFGLAPFDEEMINADFWVLVDGTLKFKQTQVKARGKAGLIDIALSDTDRFLTLVTTDGGDPEGRFSHGKRILPINGDWCVFVEPSLILE